VWDENWNTRDMMEFFDSLGRITGCCWIPHKKLLHPTPPHIEEFEPIRPIVLAAKQGQAGP